MNALTACMHAFTKYAHTHTHNTNIHMHIKYIQTYYTLHYTRADRHATVCISLIYIIPIMHQISFC